MSLRTGLLIALGFLLGAVLFITTSVLIAWTGPVSSPPNSNVSPPINVSIVDQVKNGGLSVNALAVFGNAILSGTSRYVNFGSTAGSNGYGLRDNAGTMEIKSSGGSWAAVSSGSGAAPGIQIFTSSGTWTKPEGVTKIQVIVTGGGGGGGTDGSSAGGGGAGATGIKIIDVSSVSSVAVTIGVGGAADITAGGAHRLSAPMFRLLPVLEQLVARVAMALPRLPAAI